MKKGGQGQDVQLQAVELEGSLEALPEVRGRHGEGELLLAGDTEEQAVVEAKLLYQDGLVPDRRIAHCPLTDKALPCHADLQGRGRCGRSASERIEGLLAGRALMNDHLEAAAFHV